MKRKSNKGSYKKGCKNGGARKGTGPKTDEFKHWLKKTIDKPRGRKRFEKIINDENDAETLVTQQGVEVPVRSSGKTYLTAFELGNSYLRGKPKQEIEHTGAIDLGQAGDYIERARKERGLR